MQMRLFLGIMIPDDIKKRLFRVAEKEYRHLPLIFREKSNYHITLIFLGLTQEEKIPEFCSRIKEISENTEPFEINLGKIEAGPGQKSRRILWAKGPAHSKLSELKNALERSLGFMGSAKQFSPHVTLARIKKSQLDRDASDINWEREISFSIPVNSIELFESKLEKGKRVYYVLESFQLK
jgi:RNA 2',3'-cyclic 3'-phosphodiesterase